MSSSVARVRAGLRDLRNRWVSNPEFQRWAARFPLTRPLARAKASDLFDLTSGFIYSQIAVAFVELDLLRALKAGSVTAVELAETAAMPRESAERLLKAGAALGLAEPLGNGAFGLGERGAALLGAPGVAAMVRHHAALYADLADPLALLRRGGGGGALSRYWPYAEASGTTEDQATADYSELMRVSQALVAEQVLNAYRIDRHRRMIDVGGGAGAFLEAVRARAPQLELTLFDLPAVAEAAGRRFAAEGVPIQTAGGDFFRDPFPEGADLISLIRILHDHDDAPAQALLQRVRTALKPGGRLLIGEPMAGVRGAEKAGDAYFGMYLLAMGSGRARTPGELAGMLRHAGFRRSWRVPTDLPLIASVMVAQA